MLLKMLPTSVSFYFIVRIIIRINFEYLIIQKYFLTHQIT